MEHWKLTQAYESDAGQVRWDRFGDPAAPPVVLLHGTPFSSYVWRRVVRALTPRHQVYVWDMPGYGSSEMAPGQDVSLASQGRTFAALLAHWELAEPTVVAHDVGGATALRAMLLHGARYRRLALVDAVALGGWGSPFFRLVQQHAEVFSALPSALHRALVREYISSATAVGLLPDTLEHLVRPWLGDTGQAGFYRQIAQADQAHTAEIEHRFGEITIPVLVCWGTEDQWIPAAEGRQLARRFPAASLQLIPQAGHLVQEDAPAELTAALLDFVRAG